MAYSRFSRYEEVKEKRRLFYSIAGSIVILVFLGLFGFKILVGFSLLVEKLKGGSATTTQTTTVILQPPILDPQPIATNSANFVLTGQAQPKLTLIVYLNDQEAKKLTVPDDGNVKITDLSFKDGTNTLSAKVTDGKNVSGLSNVLSTQFSKTAPPLDVSTPGDNSTINGGDQTVVVNGKTNEEDTVTINDRLVVVKGDGSFSYTINLNNGSNDLKIVSTDPAGNQTTVERHVTYQK